MMHTKFKEKDPERLEKMTQLWAQLFAVCIAQAGKPLLQTIVYLNENFERIYNTSITDMEVYETVFDELDIEYKHKSEGPNED